MGLSQTAGASVNGYTQKSAPKYIPDKNAYTCVNKKYS